MKKHLHVVWSGEPLQWLDEVRPEIGITIWDTGLRNSKHGFWSEFARRTGIDPRHSGGRQFMQPGFGGRGRLEIGPVAAWADQRREIEALRDACDEALRLGDRTLPAREHTLIAVANDPALRETSPWLQAIIAAVLSHESGDGAPDVHFFAHGWPHDHCSDLLPTLHGPCDGDFDMLPPAGAPHAIFEAGLFQQLGRLAAFVGCEPPAGEGAAATTRWVGGTQFWARTALLARRDAAWWTALLDFSRTLGPRSADSYERLWHAILQSLADLPTPNSQLPTQTQTQPPNPNP